MKALSPPNIESELSYAYLHAVASRAGMACNAGNRHEDNNGIDARITAWGPFDNGGYLTEVDLKIQLKATVRTPVDNGSSFSYFLPGISQYDDLRAETVGTARILVVLFLPSDADLWLTHSEDQLALSKCAYWVSLRGAPPSTNGTGTTVYLPKTQAFTPASLKELSAELSHPRFPTYTA